MLQNRDDGQMTFGERRRRRWAEIFVDQNARVSQHRLRLLDLHLPAEPGHADCTLRTGLTDDQLFLGQLVDERLRPRIAEAERSRDLID